MVEKQQIENSEHASLAHIAPAWMLIGTFAALLMLTGLTVAATWVNLGPLNLWLAMGIATLKAMLVALFFMHLAYDRPINALYLMCALLFVALFVSFSLLDSVYYQHDIANFVQAKP